MSDQPRIVRLSSGQITIRRALDGVWRVSYDPDERPADYPGHTFAPGDPDLPSDYPQDERPRRSRGVGAKPMELTERL